MYSTDEVSRLLISIQESHAVILAEMRANETLRRSDEIESRSELELKIKRIEQSAVRMHQHIEFVESIFAHIRAPLYFILDSIRPFANRLTLVQDMSIRETLAIDTGIENQQVNSTGDDLD